LTPTGGLAPASTPYFFIPVLLAGDIATASETPGTSPTYLTHWERRERPRFPHRQQ
jgi:hypothetical protein